MIVGDYVYNTSVIGFDTLPIKYTQYKTNNGVRVFSLSITFVGLLKYMCIFACLANIENPTQQHKCINEKQRGQHVQSANINAINNFIFH